MSVLELDGAAVQVETSDGEKAQILAPTSLRLTEQRIGVIGANGSGKSTLARLFNGLAKPSSGRVLVDGIDVATDAARVRRMVGFCFTDPAAQLVMPTCVEDVELSLRAQITNADERRARAIELLDRFGLAQHADQSVHALSGGQRQLLALAGVLAVRPRVLIADEPTTLLDLANTRLVAHTLFGLSEQLLVVTHDLDLAARCDRVLVVEQTRVRFDGPPQEAIADYLSTVPEVAR